MKEMWEIKKELVISILSSENKKSTRAISKSIKANWERTLDLLDCLLKEKKIIRTEETIATYWKISKKMEEGIS